MHFGAKGKNHGDDMFDGLLFFKFDLLFGMKSKVKLDVLVLSGHFEEVLQVGLSLGVAGDQPSG
jgi:hypothetical protein